MSVPAGPPAQPPQLSPDRKWIWDGTQWRPVAQHQAVFPSWNSVGAGVAAEAPPAQQQRMPSPPPQATPAPPVYAYRVPAPAPAAPPEVPLWQRRAPSSGINKVLYVVAGGIGLVVVGILFTSFGSISFPWQQAPVLHASAKPTPPLTQRSDSARADRFVNGLLAPDMSALNDNLTLVRGTCAGAMTTSCEENLINTDDSITAMVPVIAHETLPLCISPQAASLRIDLGKLDDAVQLALKGFRDNRPSEEAAGLNSLGGANGQVQADYGALGNAARSCNPGLTGP